MDKHFLSSKRRLVGHPAAQICHQQQLLKQVAGFSSLRVLYVQQARDLELGRGLCLLASAFCFSA